MLIALNVFLLCITSVTVIYAAFTFQRTAENTFVVNNIGTVNCTVTLSNGNVFLADSSGNKTSTTAKIFPGGTFAIPLSITYTGTLPNGGVIGKTGATTITAYSVELLTSTGSNYAISNQSTTINNVFTQAEIRCSGSTTITSTANTNFYLLLAVRSPSSTLSGSSNNTATAQNYFTNSITSATISFNLTVLTNTTS